MVFFTCSMLLSHPTPDPQVPLGKKEGKVTTPCPTPGTWVFFANAGTSTAWSPTLSSYQTRPFVLPAKHFSVLSIWLLYVSKTKASTPFTCHVRWRQFWKDGLVWEDGWAQRSAEATFRHTGFLKLHGKKKKKKVKTTDLKRTEAPMVSGYLPRGDTGSVEKSVI